MKETVVILNNDKKIGKLILPILEKLARKLDFTVLQLFDPSELVIKLKELSINVVLLDEDLIKKFEESLVYQLVSRFVVFLLLKNNNRTDELPDFPYGGIFIEMPPPIIEKTLFYSLKTAFEIDKYKKKVIVDPEYLKKLISDSVHSINNILTGMQGYAELAQMNPEDKKLIEDSFMVVVDSANKVKLELKNFRAFVRVEAPQFEKVDIEDVINEAISLVKNDFETNGIQLNLNLQTGGMINADYNQIVQVLFNILYDLAKSITEGGEISIRGEAHDYNYVFKISSSDVKIDEQEAQTIKNILSEPYIVMKDEEGLGKIEKRSVLSICNRILYNHLGRIVFDYSKEEGTSYQITIPIITIKPISTAPGEVEVKGEEPIISGVKKPTGDVGFLDMDVLVVDDEEYIRNTIHYFFNEKGCRVIQAEDGEFALDLASKQSFDLIFMDYLMPKMGGLEAAKRIKKLNNDARIVFITGRETIDQKEIQKVGAYSIIKKPFDLKALLNIVKKVALEKGQVE